MGKAEDDLARLAAKPQGVIILEVPETMREALESMRPDEVTAFVRLVRMGPEGVEQLTGALKLYQSISTVGKFVKWVLIVFLGFFVAGGAIIKGLHEYWTYFTGGKVG